MILDLQKLSYNTLLRGLKESHIEGIVDFRFILEKNIPAELKNAVKKAAKAKYLDDADMVLVFKIAKSPAPQTENPAPQTQGDQAPTDQVSEGEEQATENPEETQTKDNVVKAIKRCFYLGDNEEDKIETVSLEISGGSAYLVKFTFPE